MLTLWQAGNFKLCVIAGIGGGYTDPDVDLQGSRIPRAEALTPFV